ncbi:MAG: sugar ABC transporter substrate-binding protein [Chloroflexi bacterium]|nr:sugar ABC transporter substrate-binding protein [Chloroflexota bacterium]
MKKKQTNIFLGFLIPFFLILVGCTANPTPEPSVFSPTPITPTKQNTPIETPNSADAVCPDGVVEISMDDWSNTDEALAARTEIITAFNVAHPCINVIFVDQLGFGADAHRLEQIRSGSASDLIAVESVYIPIYTESGGLADLSPFIEADLDFDPDEIYFESVWKAGFYQEKPRAINKDFSTSAIYINTSLFEQAEIPLPEEGWTYDDYLEMALALTLDKNGNNAKSPEFDPENIVQYGTTVPYWGGGLLAWFRGFENVLYSFDAHAISPDATTTLGYLNSNNAVEAWEFTCDLVHKYHVSPQAEDIDNIGGNDVLFREGKLAISGHYWGPWYQEAFDATPGLKWTVVPLPTGPNGHKGVIMWMGWGINQQSEHPQEAWKLLKWLTTEPGQRIYTRRALTQVKSLAVELQRINDPFWGVFIAETEYVDTLDDALHPGFFPCVSEDATAEFLLKTWKEGGDQLNIQQELDKLALDANRCLRSKE